MVGSRSNFDCQHPAEGGPQPCIQRIANTVEFNDKSSYDEVLVMLGEVI